MVVISSTIMVGPITDALDPDGQPKGEGGAALARSFPRFAADNARTFALLTFNLLSTPANRQRSARVDSRPRR